MIWRQDRKRDVWVEAGVGLAGGLVASWAMGFVHQGWQKLTNGAVEQNAQDSTVAAASAVSECLFHHELTADEKRLAGPVVHFAFGGSMGALYGAAVAGAPPLSVAAGLPFGTAVWLGAHVTAVPKLGLSEPPMERPLVQEAGEFVAHLVYGLITEFVRRGVLAVVRAARQ